MLGELSQLLVMIELIGADAGPLVEVGECWLHVGEVHQVVAALFPFQLVLHGRVFDWVLDQN